MADNSYAVSNLQQVKENIMAYASFAEGHQYSPLYEKIEEAQAAVQRLIDAIESKEDSDDDTPEETDEGLAYLREQLEQDEIEEIRAQIDRSYRYRMAPSDCVTNVSKVIDLLEEYGADNDLPEGWWENEGDIDDWLLKL